VAKQRFLSFQSSLLTLTSLAVREKVQSAVHRRFKEWFVKSGQMRQVHDLIS
jgi:hypothetical protein